MHDFRALKILDKFKLLFKKINIDYSMLRRIIAIKLLMDKRRVPKILDNTKKRQRSPFIKSLWIYFLYSFLLVFFIFGETYMVQMSIIFGIALFIIMTALIADFSSVMLDVSDRAIIGTKPIDKRTIGLAKVIHILIYLVQITGAFTIIPIIFMLFVQGILFTTLFIVVLTFFILFILASTSLIYIFILKLLSGEQLKNMINYFQIIFAVGVIIGYQLVIRGYGFIDLNATYLFKWWHALLPPMWFAAPFELILNRNFSIQIIILSFSAFILPLLVFIIYYLLIPTFETHLQKLLETTNLKTKKIHFIETMWKYLLSRTEKKRSYFQFVYRIINREREFKLKVYPSLGIGLILPFILIFSETGIRSFSEIAESNLYLCIYLMHIFIAIAIYTFQFSGSFKGSWIFTVSGNTSSSELYGAVLKVFLVKLYLPMFIIVGTSFYLLFDNFNAVDLAIVFVSAIIQALLSYKMIVESKYPFSLSFATSESNDKIGKAFLLMLLTIPFAIFHFVSTLLPFLIIVYVLVLCVIAIYLWCKLLVNTK